LNPQPIIDAKTAALKELGVKLTYAGRKWHAGDREFTSLELSQYTVEEFAKLFAKGAKSKPASSTAPQKNRNCIAFSLM